MSALSPSYQLAVYCMKKSSYCYVLYSTWCFDLSSTPRDVHFILLKCNLPFLRNITLGDYDQCNFFSAYSVTKEFPSGCKSFFWMNYRFDHDDTKILDSLFTKQSLSLADSQLHCSAVNRFGASKVQLRFGDIILWKQNRNGLYQMTIKVLTGGRSPTLISLFHVKLS